VTNKIPRGVVPVVVIAAACWAACDTSSDVVDDLQGNQPPPDTQANDCANDDAFNPPPVDMVDPEKVTANTLFDEGRRIFRFDTFGSEAFFGGKLGLHQAIAGDAHGGVGPGLSPKTALELGLKVDMTAVPAPVVAALEAGEVDLGDPSVTLLLLQVDAVVGVKGIFGPDMNLAAVGIRCSFCHSTVDDAFAPGIGHRLDGWPNRDLDVGQIVALSPTLAPIAQLLGVDEPTVRTVLMSWGPGKYDAELNHDGRAFRPDGKSGATLIPAAYGLAGTNLHTYTGWGSVPYWNAYVAVTQMMGQGTFFDPRLNDPVKFPIAAATGRWNIRPENDLVTSKLPALQLYQLSLAAPTPPAGSFDAEAAERGDELFEGKAQCSTCHVEPLYTEPGWAMHSAQEMGIDDFQASRSPDGNFYRTTPLRGLFARMKGGFYHDGRFPTLEAVIDHYDMHFRLGLTAHERADLVEYLKSI
jgi:hypothetical protein